MDRYVFRIWRLISNWSAVYLEPVDKWIRSGKVSIDVPTLRPVFFCSRKTFMYGRDNNFCRWNVVDLFQSIYDNSVTIQVLSHIYLYITHSNCLSFNLRYPNKSKLFGYLIRSSIILRPYRYFIFLFLSIPLTLSFIIWLFWIWQIFSSDTTLDQQTQS